MKNFAKSNLIAILFLFYFSISNAQICEIMSYNIRYATDNDGKNSWENRKYAMLELINYYNPDIFGIQEGLLEQVEYLNDNLSKYKYIGVGRDDGDKKGEFSAIFYDTTKFTNLNQTTFWLSKTPGKISVGWDAAMERICTYGLFENNKTQKKIWIFNTHFDHIGKKARKNSAALLISKFNELSLKKIPVVLMGDFNSTPNSDAIKIIKAALKDAFTISQKPPYGPEGTFNGFDAGNLITERIDYIFLHKMHVISYVNIDDKRKDNNFISDHLPVYIISHF